MKKIILAFDGTNFSEGAFEFARRLNALQPVLLTGVFLPQTELAGLWSYAEVHRGSSIPLIEHQIEDTINRNIARFEERCVACGIEYRIHEDYFDFALPELRKESQFADLLILGSQVFFDNAGEAPNDYLLDILHGVKCPVILVPEKFDFPESIIMAYDGSEDSVFAIKQFAYLFPELTGKETLLVYANEDAEIDFPDKVQIEELAARHFSDLTLFKLDLNPRKYFAGWIATRKSAMLVCGSYGRNDLSILFKRSFVKAVIADHRLPVFIAHK